MGIFDKSHINIAKVLKDTNVPILILDQAWHENFPENYRNDKISNYEKTIKELLKENARLSERTKELIEVKRESLSKIINLTTEAYEKDNHVAKERIDEMQKKVVACNEEMEQNAILLEKIDPKISKVNFQLLEETIAISYGLLNESTEKLNKISPKVEKMRLEFTKLIEEEKNLKDQATNTYNLLHNLVGQEIIDKLDEQSRGKGARYGNRNRN